MNLKSASGLTLVELVVIVVLLALFSATIPVGSTRSITRANMVAVGCRGRDIFVSIEGANTERKPLGLPPVWPCDFDSSVVTDAEEQTLLGVSNSTDFFRVLYDEERMGTSDHAPYVAGFDYSKLAGAGVRFCLPGQKLTATNNIWTVAKNVRADMDDMIPVLITRNIEASSLAASASEQDLKGKTLRFDPGWQTPFGDKGFVLIRKGGAIFNAPAKYMGYRVVYQNNVFDTALATNGTALPPLKYLTPTREVTPSAQAYADGAEIAYRQAGGWWGLHLREPCGVVAAMWPLALFWALIYLSFFAHYTTRRKKRGLNPRPAAPVLGGWFCHYLSVVLYLTALIEMDAAWPWEYACAAVGAQAVGIALAFALPEQERAARRRQVLWVLLVPLQLGALFAFLSLCCR